MTFIPTTAAPTANATTLGQASAGANTGNGDAFAAILDGLNTPGANPQTGPATTGLFTGGANPAAPINPVGEAKLTAPAPTRAVNGTSTATGATAGDSTASGSAADTVAPVRKPAADDTAATDSDDTAAVVTPQTVQAPAPLPTPAAQQAVPTQAAAAGGDQEAQTPTAAGAAGAGGGGALTPPVAATPDARTAPPAAGRAATEVPGPSTTAATSQPLTAPTPTRAGAPDLPAEKAPAPSSVPAVSVALGTALASAPAAATGSPAQATAVPADFQAQLAKPVFSLAAAGNGDHAVTVRVTPENLGPVTVRAHVSGQNMHIELFSPSDAGRDAIRQIMPELRRDLASSGMNANLDLSSRSQPDQGFTGERQSRQDTPDPYRETQRRPAPAQIATASPHVLTRGSATSLDVIA